MSKVHIAIEEASGAETEGGPGPVAFRRPFWTDAEIAPGPVESAGGSPPDVGDASARRVTLVHVEQGETTRVRSFSLAATEAGERKFSTASRRASRRPSRRSASRNAARSGSLGTAAGSGVRSNSVESAAAGVVVGSLAGAAARGGPPRAPRLFAGGAALLALGAAAFVTGGVAAGHVAARAALAFGGVPYPPPSTFFVRPVRRGPQAVATGGLLVYYGAAYALLSHVAPYPSALSAAVAAGCAAAAGPLRLRLPFVLLTGAVGVALSAVAAACAGLCPADPTESRLALFACVAAAGAAAHSSWIETSRTRQALLRRRNTVSDLAAIRPDSNLMTRELKAFQEAAASLGVGRHVASFLRRMERILGRQLAAGRAEDASDLMAALRLLLNSRAFRSSVAAPQGPPGLYTEGEESPGGAAAAAGADNVQVQWIRSLMQAPGQGGASTRRRHSSASITANSSPGTPRPRSFEPLPAPPSLDAALSDESSAGLAAALDKASSWTEFDIEAVDRLSHGRPLQAVGTALLKAARVVDEMGVDRGRLRTFLERVEAGYRATPYHNRMHAAEVVQGLYFLLFPGGLRPYVRSADVLAALVAAAVHDLDHTGRTNGFEVATGSELALLYNDQSVLEHNALTRTFAMLRDPDCDFLSSFTREQRAEFRRSVIALVLATDMSRHLETVSAWKALLVTETLEAAGADVEAEGDEGEAEDGEEADDEGDGDGADSEGPADDARSVASGRSGRSSARGNSFKHRRSVMNLGLPVPPLLARAVLPQADRRLFLSMALKVADIANGGRPFATHERWARRIVEEFGAQGDEERRLGLPVSPLCDRSESLARAQEGFLTFLAVPLYAAWCARFPGAAALLEHAERHLAHWSALAAAERDAAAGAERPAEAAAP
eukprot:tig00020892_g14917.t1